MALPPIPPHPAAGGLHAPGGQRILNEQPWLMRMLGSQIHPSPGPYTEPLPPGLSHFSPSQPSLVDLLHAAAGANPRHHPVDPPMGAGGPSGLPGSPDSGGGTASTGLPLSTGLPGQTPGNLGEIYPLLAAAAGHSSFGPAAQARKAGDDAGAAQLWMQHHAGAMAGRAPIPAWVRPYMTRAQAGGNMSGAPSSYS